MKVIVTNKFQRYHCNKECTGLKEAKRIRYITEELAVKYNLKPCGRCYPCTTSSTTRINQ